MFGSEDLWSPIRLTLALASITTVLLLGVGTPVAWWLARSKARWKEAVATVVALPLVLPPTVWAKPSTAPVMNPGRASGTATDQKASQGDARSVAATSRGRSPNASKALRIGCTTNGIE